MMDPLEQEQVLAALRTLVDPNTGKDYVAGKSVKNIQISGRKVSVDIELCYPAKSQFQKIASEIIQAVAAIPGVKTVHANVNSKIIARAVQPGIKPLSKIKNIVAVASGKGGVGKSTTAANLALALAAEGAAVGMLDADIYGPSQLMMMGISGRPVSLDGETLEPLENFGIQVASVGFMVDPDQPIAWRGPMVTKVLEQLLSQTNWRDLDYLIIDMPPGTGDVQLTVSQKIPVTGEVIVTTPQDIALLDARKGLKMFEKVSIPILGIVENMASHIYSVCSHVEPIFGIGGGEKMCRQYGVDFLGSLPLNMSIREFADAGIPLVAANPEGKVAEIYKAIARRIAVKIGEKGKDMSKLFPPIIVYEDKVKGSC